MVVCLERGADCLHTVQLGGETFQTYNHASTPPLSFLQAGCPSCRLSNSVKAMKAHLINY